MRQGAGYPTRRLVEYDALRRRLWILGQRCHHGATGSLVAGAAFLALLVDPPPPVMPHSSPRSTLAVVAAGGALMMAHDWKDRSLWFERGRGSQG
jgi:hypothetical protein